MQAAGLRGEVGSRFKLLFLAVATSLLLGGWTGSVCAASSQGSTSPATGGTIVAVGDSLTEGLGVPPGENYPAQLERKLHKAGYRWRVVNAGISGETSSGTLSRIDWVLKLKPDIVVLVIGANDGFRGVNPRLIRDNINQIVTRLQQKGVVVVLGGMKMLTNMGPSYTKEFASVYPKIASEHGLILMPFFLEGVAGVPSLNLPDTIHPQAKGYSIVTDKLYPYVIKAIERKSGKKASGKS